MIDEIKKVKFNEAAVVDCFDTHVTSKPISLRTSIFIEQNEVTSEPQQVHLLHNMT